MAASTTAAVTSGAPLRVRLDGPTALHERAAWAIEALLARVRVRDWELVGEGAADVDLAWSDDPRAAPLVLACDPASWEFRWDREPDPDVDPLAAAFWWLARVEEQLAPESAFDEHGRFDERASALARRTAAGEEHPAPVDELARGVLGPVAERWGLPFADGEPRWRLVATHDIDLPLRGTPAGRRRALRAVRDGVRRGRIGEALRAATAVAARPLEVAFGDPWDNHERITHLERSLGARSTSYLLAGANVAEDGDPQMHELGAGWARVQPGRDGVDDRLGLHGSYTSSVVAGRLEAERDELESRLGVPILDHRFHYLRHRIQDAWPLLDSIGLRTDSSLGFAGRPGLRAGTALPFRAWDHAAGRPLDLVVIPLAVMDASYESRYLDLRGRRVDAHVRRVLDRVAALGGSASLLTHNDRICCPGADWTARYRRILQWVRASGGVACTAATAGAAYEDLLPAHRRPRR
jgi:hypothetical protein